jgi:hypothetical protein
MCFAALLLSATLLRLAAGLWPDFAFLLPVLLAVGPTILFFGFVGGVLAGDGFPRLATMNTLRLAGRLLGIAGVYLIPAAATVVAVGYVTASGTIPAVLTGVTTAMFATIALLVTVVCAYLLPAAAIVSVREGLRAGVRRDALRGTASGTYFLGWVGATVLVVLAWSALVATMSRSVASLLTLGWVAYAHVAAAALVAECVGRTHPW